MTSGASPPVALAVPDPGPDAARAWVSDHLGDLVCPPYEPSTGFRGGQVAADARLGAFEVAGYAHRRNEVWPPGRQGASGLSPYIRHGLLTLRTVWDQVAGGPPGDVAKFRYELAWQEYARHLYARVGAGTGVSLRHRVVERAGDTPPWPDGHQAACVDLWMDDLGRDGWLTNAQRLWLASHWSVRHGGGWRDGEDWLFARLLDGSRAANRLGWQWTVGAASTRPSVFTRRNVEQRAPGLCPTCARRTDCPVESLPGGRAADPAGGVAGGGTPVPTRLAAGGDGPEVTGPVEPHGDPGAVDAVWITAESLGDDDPAMAAHPEVPAVFVVDRTLLQAVSVSGMRMVFMAETLADLATRRPVEIWLGQPAGVFADRRVAATFAPVPGWRRHAAAVHPQVVYPWPWLVRPGGAPLQSFTAWSKRVGDPVSGLVRSSRR